MLKISYMATVIFSPIFYRVFIACSISAHIFFTGAYTASDKCPVKNIGSGHTITGL